MSMWYIRECTGQRRTSAVLSITLHLIPLRQRLSRNLELGCGPASASHPPVATSCSTGVRHSLLHVALYLGVGDLNLGPHAYIAIEPSL